MAHANTWRTQERDPPNLIVDVWCTQNMAKFFGWDPEMKRTNRFSLSLLVSPRDQEKISWWGGGFYQVTKITKRFSLGLLVRPWDQEDQEIFSWSLGLTKRPRENLFVGGRNFAKRPREPRDFLLVSWWDHETKRTKRLSLGLYVSPRDQEKISWWGRDFTKRPREPRDFLLVFWWNHETKRTNRFSLGLLVSPRDQ